jgi:hypothetical protein
MGQKVSKSNNLSNNNNNINSDGLLSLNSKINQFSTSAPSFSSSSSSAASTTSAKSSKSSNHYSAISNDSGCYTNTDRYSTPSSSSLLFIYDLASSNNNTNNNKNITLRTNNSKLRSKSQNQKRCSTLKNRDFVNNRNSLCDSIILSCSSSSSNSYLGNTKNSSNFVDYKTQDLTNKNENDEEEEDQAQILCDQLNTILNISNKLSEKAGQIDQMDSIRVRSSTNRFATRLKTLRLYNNNNKNTCKMMKTNLTPRSKLSRSFTFSSNIKEMEKYQNCNHKVLNNLLKNGQQTIESNKKSEDEKESKNILSNLFLKNSRKLFSTLNQNNQSKNNSKMALSNLKIIKDNKNPLLCTLKSENDALIDLIAAKLEIESIDLTELPYTDEVSLKNKPMKEDFIL